ncbi:MAG: hypothetical protein ABW007_00595 [Chitinophagaceae bacterium]
MRPTPIHPKRADFASFDDYFDAMIQYHLDLLPQDSEEEQEITPLIQAFHFPAYKDGKPVEGINSRSGSVQRPEGKKAWQQKLQQFVQAHQQ